MSQHRIPITPPNYSIWYDFVGDRNAALAADIRSRLDQGLKFPPEFCQRLYQRHFVDPLLAQVDDFDATLQRTMAAVIREIGELDEDLGGFASSRRCSTTPASPCSAARRRPT